MTDYELLDMALSAAIGQIALDHNSEDFPLVGQLRNARKSAKEMRERAIPSPAPEPPKPVKTRGEKIAEKMVRPDYPGCLQVQYDPHAEQPMSNEDLLKTLYTQAQSVANDTRRQGLSVDSVLAVVPRLPTMFGPERGDLLPDDMIGSRIISIGAIVSGAIVEGGGLVIDYQTSGGAPRRLVIASNDQAMWVVYQGRA